jgi:hypothetical protein
MQIVARARSVDPPALRWPLVLILSIVTLGLFEDAWLLWQSRWAKRVDPSSRGTKLLVAGVVLFLIGAILSVFADLKSIAGWVDLAGFVMSQVGNFSVKGSIEKYYKVSLSGLMTIFFSSIYFQYHFDLAKAKP